MVDPQSLCQIEIQVADVDKSVAFYERVFGWRRTPADIHECIVLEVPAGCPFGISLIPSRSSLGDGRDGGRLVLYFGVNDPKAVMGEVEAAGGKKRFGPTRLGSYGEIHQFSDPDGQRFGLFQRKSTDSSISSEALRSNI